MFIEADQFYIAFSKMLESWRADYERVRIPANAEEEGRNHALMEILRDYDEFTMVDARDYDAAIETTVHELLRRCETAPDGYTAYGRSYKVTMSECASDLRKMMSKTVGY